MPEWLIWPGWWSIQPPRQILHKIPAFILDPLPLTPLAGRLGARIGSLSLYSPWNHGFPLNS